MTLFITSSPYIDGADRAILDPRNELVDRLRAVLPANPRALFVCSDPDSRDLTCRFGADTAMAFCLAGMAFSSYAILDGQNMEDAASLVENSDLIVFAGGHVPTQNAFLQDCGLRELLEDFGGAVMGISAGSMNLADEVYVQPEEPGESAPSFQRFAPGLGLTEVNILPHYQKVKNYMLDGKRLYEDITYADSWGHTFFVLPDGSWIYQDEEELTLLGEGYMIRNGIMELLTKEGETLDLSVL
jgi:dipeptidase E